MKKKIMNELEKATELLGQYRRRFDHRPDITYIGLTANNSGLLNRKLREALDRNTPFTKKEEQEIENKTFKSYYDLVKEAEKEGSAIPLM